MIFVAPLWLLALLTPFFTMVGRKAILEIKKEKARDKQKEKKFKERQAALKRLEEDLQRAEEAQLERTKEEFARVAESKRAAQELKNQIEAMCVEITDDPYLIANKEKEEEEDE